MREQLDEIAKRRLKEALLALNEGPDRSLLKKLYGVDGYVEVGPETYAEAEALAMAEGFLPARRPGR